MAKAKTPLKPRGLTVAEQATLNYWRVSRYWHRGATKTEQGSEGEINVGQGLALLNEATPGPHRKVVPLIKGLLHDIIHNARGPKEKGKGVKHG